MSLFLTNEIVKDKSFLQSILAPHKKWDGEVRRLVGGSKSFAFAVSNYVIRFPKAEIIWQTMLREKQILDAIYLMRMIFYYLLCIHALL